METSFAHVNKKEEKSKEETLKEFKENFRKFIEIAPKEEVLSFIYKIFTEDETQREARSDLIAILEKMISIVERYFEFKVRELTDKGLMLNHSFMVEKFWNGVRLTIEVRFGKDAITDMSKWLEFIKLSRASDKEVKRYLLKRLDFAEEEVGMETRILEHPKDKLREKVEKIMEGEE